MATLKFCDRCGRRDPCPFRAKVEQKEGHFTSPISDAGFEDLCRSCAINLSEPLPRDAPTEVK